MPKLPQDLQDLSRLLQARLLPHLPPCPCQLPLDRPAPHLCPVDLRRLQNAQACRLPHRPGPGPPVLPQVPCQAPPRLAPLFPLLQARADSLPHRLQNAVDLQAILPPRRAPLPHPCRPRVDIPPRLPQDRPWHPLLARQVRLPSQDANPRPLHNPRPSNLPPPQVPATARNSPFGTTTKLTPSPKTGSSSVVENNPPTLPSKTPTSPANMP